MTLLTVRMTKHWRGHHPGEVLTLERGVADIYVNVRRVAVFISTEEEPAHSPVEYMVPRKSVKTRR